jgi:hypothetical protein
MLHLAGSPLADLALSAANKPLLILFFIAPSAHQRTVAEPKLRYLVGFPGGMGIAAG